MPVSLSNPGKSETTTEWELQGHVRRRCPVALIHFRQCIRAVLNKRSCKHSILLPMPTYNHWLMALFGCRKNKDFKTLLLCRLLARPLH